MASSYYDIMRPGVEQFAYLKCPTKVRAAVINAGGPRLSVEVIKRQLASMPSKIEGAHIGEPTESDAIDFRVGGLVKGYRVKQSGISQEDRANVARLAKGIGDKPKQSKERTFKYRAPRTNHASTGYAEKLIDEVSEALDMPRDVLLGESRLKLIVAARSLICALLRDRSTDVYSYPRIAAILCRKDHSTMIHSHQQFGHYCSIFPDVAALYEELRGDGQ